MKTMLAVAALALPLSIATAQAMPLGSPALASPTPTLVSGGCGKARHRGYYDACRAGAGWSPHGPNRLRRGGPGRASTSS